jgi:hypothetical protein
MKRWLIAVMVAVWCGAVLMAWTDGPLTPLMTLAGRTDENGYLRVSGGTPGATDGPLTALANLRGRTDENGYLRVALAGGTATTITLTTPAITPASAAGTVVVDPGSVRTQTYRVNVGTTAFVCNAVTCDVTIGTLPVNTRVMQMDADLVQAFACTATCTSSTLSILIGKGSGGAEYIASFDADAAVAWFGDADAEMGTLLTRAAAIQGGTFSAASQAVVLRLTSGTGNVGNGTVTNLSAGSVRVRITTTVMP